MVQLQTHEVGSPELASTVTGACHQVATILGKVKLQNGLLVDFERVDPLYVVRASSILKGFEVDPPKIQFAMVRAGCYESTFRVH